MPRRMPAAKGMSTAKKIFIVTVAIAVSAVSSYVVSRMFFDTNLSDEARKLRYNENRHWHKSNENRFIHQHQYQELDLECASAAFTNSPQSENLTDTQRIRQYDECVRRWYKRK